MKNVKGLLGLLCFPIPLFLLDEALTAQSTLWLLSGLIPPVSGLLVVLYFYLLLPACMPRPQIFSLLTH